MPGSRVRLGLVLTVQQRNEERADTQTLGSGEQCMQQLQPQQPKPQPGLCAEAVGVRSSQQEVRVGEKSQVAILWREGRELPLLVFARASPRHSGAEEGFATGHQPEAFIGPHMQAGLHPLLPQSLKASHTHQKPRTGLPDLLSRELSVWLRVTHIPPPFRMQTPSRYCGTREITVLICERQPGWRGNPPGKE